MSACLARLAVAMLSMAAVASAAPSGPPTGDPGAGGVDGVLARIQQVEDATRNVSLSFRQTTLLKATGDSQDTTGTLVLQRASGLFRVTFLTPVEQVAVYDGKSLWLYLPAAGQAFRQKAGAGELERVLGVNPAEPVRGFRRGYSARLNGCDARGCAIDFIRGGEAGMTWHVRVSATTWRMEEAWFENGEVRVSLACYDYRVNRKLAPREFRMTLPSDVEVQDGLPMLFGRGAP